MRPLRQNVPELWFACLVLGWLLLTAAQGDGIPEGAKDVGGIGVAFGGLALLIRAIAPLLRRADSGGVDRDDVRWQEQTSAAIDGLARSLRDWAEEQRRHNQQVELLMRQSMIPRPGEPI